MNIKERVDLKSRNFWQVGGVADYLFEAQTPEELQEALLWAESKNQPVSVIGKGTNVLISDEGIRGLVICTSQLKNFECVKEGGFLKISAESGLLKSKLMTLFREYQLSPALFLSGLPGDIGGGVVMNAGSGKDFHPKDFSGIVSSFKTLTVQGLRHYEKKDIEWGYRFTKGWKGVIYKIDFEWPLDQKETAIHKKIKEALKKRRLTQPLDQPSCGSVFKNPYPLFAGALIEKLGLKGYKKGGASISKKHGNFIVNEGSASARDIHYLIQKIKNEVKKNFNIDLETEVRYLGCWDE